MRLLLGRAGCVIDQFAAQDKLFCGNTQNENIRMRRLSRRLYDVWLSADETRRVERANPKRSFREKGILTQSLATQCA